jgi:hypothetical protein
MFLPFETDKIYKSVVRKMAKAIVAECLEQALARVSEIRDGMNPKNFKDVVREIAEEALEIFYQDLQEGIEKSIKQLKLPKEENEKTK